MAVSVKLSDKIVADAKKVSGIMNRSVAGQIEFWAKIGQMATENRNLTYEQITDLLFEEQESANAD